MNNLPVVRNVGATLVDSALAGALIDYWTLSLHRVGLTLRSAGNGLLVGNAAGIVVRVANGWFTRHAARSGWWLA
jgi:hypothetical protein